MAVISAEVTCVWRGRAILGEAPCWDGRTQSLFWTDIKGLRLHAWQPGTAEHRSWPLPVRLMSLDAPSALWSQPPDLGGLAFLGCSDEGFTWIAVEGEEVRFRPIVHPEAHRSANRFNDGKLGPDGRYWAGTMDDAEQRATGALYAFRSDGTWQELDTGYRVTNGPAFSPDGAVVYHNDSARRVTYCFDATPSGALAGKRIFASFAEDEGHPDGMTTDLAGNVWIAMWDGHRLLKLAPDGRRLGCVRMPTARVTSCVFADPGCTEMFVTSASIGAAADDLLAGGLFKVVLDE